MHSTTRRTGRLRLALAVAVIGFISSAHAAQDLASSRAPDYAPSLEELYGVPNVNKSPSSVYWVKEQANDEKLVLLARACESRPGMLNWLAREVMDDKKSAPTKYQGTAFYAELLDDQNHVIQQGCWALTESPKGMVIWKPTKGVKRASTPIVLNEMRRVDH